MKLAALLVATLLSACTVQHSVAPDPTTSSGPNERIEGALDRPSIEIFDIAGDDERVTPFTARAPAPLGAQPAFVVRSYADPAALDEMLAQAEAVAGPEQVIVGADISGCILLTMWAVPRPSDVLVGYEFDPDINCAEAISYRALFILDQHGSNQVDTWDYSGGRPDVTLQSQPPNGG